MGLEKDKIYFLKKGATMKKSHQILFLLFTLIVCALYAILPLFSFEKDEKILFGLTVEELQGYVYFISSGILVALLIQYTHKIFTSDKNNEEDYEKYSNIALYDEEGSKPIEKL